MAKEAEGRKQIKFLIEIVELNRYNERSDNIEKQIEDKAIRDHQGALKSKHPDYMGSRYNVLACSMG